MKNRYSCRWIYVVNGFLALLCIGCSYAWSVFIVPMEQELHWARSFTLNIIFYSAGSLLAGVMTRKISYPAMMRIAAVLVGAGFFLTSFVIRPWQVYLTYSLLCGCGIGIGYNCVVSVVPRWFPGQTGLVSGILLVGYALSTAVFGPSLSAMISSVGIAVCFRILAGLCLAVLLAVSILTCPPSVQQAEMLPKPRQSAARREQKGYRPSEIVRMPVFWINMVLSALLSGCGLTIINHISPLMTEDVGATAAAAAAVISLNAVSNGTGRILAGLLYDKKGPGIVMRAIPLIEGIGFAFLAAGLRPGNIFLCTIGSGVVVFGFGAAANMIPTMARELFGEKFFSINFPIVNISSIAAACIPTLTGTLQIAFHGYEIPMWILLGADGICFLLSFVLIGQMKK